MCSAGNGPPMHTHRGWGRQGGGRHLHAHKTIPICLRRQTPLLGFLGSRSCTNMWKRNVSLLSAGHTCNSIYCSHVQEIHQTGPISSRGEKQSIRDRGKPTLNSIPYFTLIGLDSERGVGGREGLLGRRCSRAHRAGKPPAATQLPMVSAHGQKLGSHLATASSLL